MNEEHEALVILTRLTEHLRKQYLPLPVNGKKVIPKWMEKAADSIEQYLNNLDVKSLDAAFGLESGHDRPSKPGPKPDKKKELAIFTEYLRILCNENPCLADDDRDEVTTQFIGYHPIGYSPTYKVEKKHPMVRRQN